LQPAHGGSAWQGDRELQDAVAATAEVLERAVRQDWSPAIDALSRPIGCS